MNYQGVEGRVKITEIILIVFSSTALPNQTKSIPVERRNNVSLTMAIEKVELVQQCFSKHLRIGTARMKEYREIQEEEKQERVKMERSGHEINKYN